MKIENIRNCCNTQIKNIEIGECVMYQGALCMKVDNGSFRFEKMSYYPNFIIDLETNVLNALHDSVVVQRVKAKIVVEQ